MKHEDAWKDGGSKSRKLWFSVFCVAVLFVGMAFIAYHEAAIGLYDTFVGGVVGLAGIYLAGNVGSKLMATKLPPPAPTKTPPSPTKAKEPELPAP